MFDCLLKVCLQQTLEIIEYVRLQQIRSVRKLQHENTHVTGAKQRPNTMYVDPFVFPCGKQREGGEETIHIQDQQIKSVSTYGCTYFVPAWLCVSISNEQVVFAMLN